MLPVPYFHTVFTLPHALNSLIRNNMQALIGCLFRAVSATLQAFAKDPRHLGAEPGLLMVLHTWGKDLKFHVHIHCLITGGGLSPDQQRWIPARRSDFLFPVRALSKVFRGKYLAEVERLVETGALFTDPAHLHWDMMTTLNMGLTAEKLFSQTDFTKEDMSRWGARAHQLAAKAQAEGFFEGEILPIEAPQDNGTVITVDKDQAVRDDTTFEGMAELKPAFKKDGVITAGNSSPLNAAATSMILMSRETAKKKGIRPLATIRSIGFAGVDPTIMGAGPVPA
jgi:hypothetical protein